MYDIDNNGVLDKTDFEHLAVKNTIMEGKGKWDAERWEFFYHVLLQNTGLSDHFCIIKKYCCCCILNLALKNEPTLVFRPRTGGLHPPFFILT